MKRIYFQYYLLVSLLALLIASFNLFSEGMFVDGVTYAAIARNMALGIGSFWSPFYTESLYPFFFEHPPLGIWFQFLLFRLFGDSIFVERLYSLSTYIITYFLILSIWKAAKRSLHLGWLPVLLWLTSGGVIWAMCNNVLENTLMIFTTFSLLCYLKYLNKQNLIWLMVAGVSLSLSFLSKGPFGLYLWIMPVAYWVVFRKTTWVQTVLQTSIIIGCTVLPILTIYFLNDSAKIFMDHYIQRQIVGSVSDVQTVESRWFIVGVFLKHLVLPLILLLLVNFLSGGRKLVFKNKHTLFFGIIAIAGVLPMLVSLKQSAFYILSVYPFAGLSLAFMLNASVADFKLNRFRLKWLNGVLIVAVVGVLYFQAGVVNRDREKVELAKFISSNLPKQTIIAIPNELYSDWSLHAYLMRYAQVSLSTKSQTQNDAWFLNSSGNNPDESEFELIHTSDQYKLWKKKYLVNK